MRHQYSVGHVAWFLSLVLDAATSLRAGSKAMAITAAFFGLSLPMPSWWCGRLWLLRLGYYKLTRAKEQANDWVWIVDHRVEVGPHKCLLILGVRLAHWPAGGGSLTHEQVEPLALYPVRHSDGQVVYQQLEATIAQTGVPREIIADHGSDVKKGIDLFCQQHAQTSSIYDIKHKTATVLKAELDPDPVWQAYVSRMGETKKKLQQTELAYLLPPAQRPKARYMNVDQPIAWGVAVLRVVARVARRAAPTAEEQRLLAAVGWITEYRGPLEQWEQMWHVVQRTQAVVHAHGLSAVTPPRLQEELARAAATARAQAVRAALLDFVTAESAKAGAGERLLGSSEVIESVFGKQKRVQGEPTKRGMTAMLLSVAGLVAETSQAVIAAALAKVKTTDVLKWSKEYLGQTLRAKRKAVFSAAEEREQNRDQLPVPI